MNKGVSMMRKNTLLKAVGREHPENEETKKTWHLVGQGVHAEHEKSGLPTLMDEMERLMEESFNRSFFGTGMLPFRRLFQEFGSRGMVYPSIDMYEDKGTIVVKAELPGLDRNDIDVRLMGNAIVISGEKKTEEKLERKDYFRMERSHGTFNRTLNLPSGIDADHATASFKDGMLEVRIPKTTGQSSGRQLKVE